MFKQRTAQTWNICSTQVKIQKENDDEVGLAIERLRQNGVNCVSYLSVDTICSNSQVRESISGPSASNASDLDGHFISKITYAFHSSPSLKMNDIRNGSNKAESTEEITTSKTVRYSATTNFEGRNPKTTTNKKRNKKKGRKVPKGKSKRVKSKQVKIKIDLPPPPKRMKLEVMNNKVISNTDETTTTTFTNSPPPPLASVLQKTRAFSPDIISYDRNRVPSSNKLKRQNSGNNGTDNSIVVVTNGKSNNISAGGQQLSTNNNNNVQAPHCVQIETISKEIDVQVQFKEQQQKHHGSKKEAISSEQQQVKPKRKRRGTRTRLAMRKSKKSKKCSVKVIPVDIETTLIENFKEEETHGTTKSTRTEFLSISTTTTKNAGQTENGPAKVSDSTEENLQRSVQEKNAVDHSSESSNVVKNNNEISISSGLMTGDPEDSSSSVVIKKENLLTNGVSRMEVDALSKSTESSQSASSNGRESESGSSSNHVPVQGSLKYNNIKTLTTTTLDSLPDAPDAMQLRRSSFYSLVSGNVRTNLENYLDGRINSKSPNRRRKRAKNGFLLHHGDNCPEDPEAPYKLHLATQVLLKLNKRRAKFKPKEDRGKSLLSYLKLVPKRSPRNGKPNTAPAPSTEEPKVEEQTPEPLFSGEWTLARKFVCGVCGQVEENFWDMVMHKGENHPGVVVTHTELAGLPPSSLVRRYPAEQPTQTTAATQASPPPCTKCSATFSTIPDLHRHIFECAGNAAWLETDKIPRKRKAKRRRGFKRRLSNTPKKGKKPDATAKKGSTEVFKCEFCSKSYKNQGWLKIHLGSHTLPVSIPLEKLPSRASFNSLSCQLFK